MLGNKSYMGVYHYNGIEIPGGVPAIVSEDTILKEQTSTPKLTKEQILFALNKFRKLYLTIEANKERLIDSLVKCVLLYDDKLVITFNFKN